MTSRPSTSNPLSSPRTSRRRNLARVLFAACFAAAVILSVRTFPILHRGLLDASVTGRSGSWSRAVNAPSAAAAAAATSAASANASGCVAAATSAPIGVAASTQLLPACSPRRPGRLRLRWPTAESAAWGSGPASGAAPLLLHLSPLARELHAHQSNCSLPIALHHMDNLYGFGSHLYVWSQALCNAMELNRRLQTTLAVQQSHWLWNDQSVCPEEEGNGASPLHCYFPHAEQRCGELQQNRPDGHILASVNVTDPRNGRRRCARLRNSGDPRALLEFRAASVEYLFSVLRPLVVAEAERQIGLLFGDIVDEDDYGDGSLDAAPLTPQQRVVRAPRNLVVVHMRWGDKFWEMDLPSEHEYVRAVCQLLEWGGDAQRGGGTAAAESEAETDAEADVSLPFDCNATRATVYLATEDPRAAQAFRGAAPPGWAVAVDRTLVELGTHRPDRGNRASRTARNTRGRAGLVALGSLLVALEGRYFVLTSQSNFSRLLNELRQAVVDRQCDNCTRVVDLRPGVW